MNERDQRLFRLQDCPGLGPATLARLLEACNGDAPDSLYGQPRAHYQREFGAPKRAADALSRGYPHVPMAPEALACLPVHAITRIDAEYPRSFLRLKRPPPLLWKHGTTPMRLTKDNICVVSSAEMEVERAERVKEAVQTALEAGYRLVAGHNRPVYQWALLAAKRAGHPSVMVLDRGLLTAFDEDLRRDPVPAARIWGYGFDVEHSVALSPFRLRDGWIGANARYRDELVIALCDTVVALGIRPDGTMHRLCREALSRGQNVFADAESLPLFEDAGARLWTGRLDDAADRGCMAGGLGGAEKG